MSVMMHPFFESADQNSFDNNAELNKLLSEPSIISEISKLAISFKIKNLFLMKLKSPTPDDQNVVHFHYTADVTLSLIEKAQFKIALANLLNNKPHDQIKLDASSYFSANFREANFTLERIIYSQNTLYNDLSRKFK